MTDDGFPPGHMEPSKQFVQTIELDHRSRLIVWTSTKCPAGLGKVRVGNYREKQEIVGYPQ
jgi:hypothetical protein